MEKSLYFRIFTCSNSILGTNMSKGNYFYFYFFIPLTFAKPVEQRDTLSKWSFLNCCKQFWQCPSSNRGWLLVRCVACFTNQLCGCGSQEARWDRGNQRGDVNIFEFTYVGTLGEEGEYGPVAVRICITFFLFIYLLTCKEQSLFKSLLKFWKPDNHTEIYLIYNFLFSCREEDAIMSIKLLW